MNLVLFGPPGCGKGTQAQLLSTHHGFVHISTGDLLRDEIRSASALGQEVQNICASGQLVSDEIIMKIVEKRIADLGTKSILFDGIPRTLNQALALDNVLAGFSARIHRVVSLSVPDSVLFQRITGRFHCKACKAVYHTQNNPTKVVGVCDVCGGADFERRADDQEASLKVRLVSYYEQTKPLESFYQKREILTEVDATQAPEAVCAQIVKLITPDQ
jgi:adenylate kinase